MQIDVFITSASRPDLLEITLESFVKNTKYSGGFRFLINEDYVDPMKSVECIAIANRITNAFVSCCSPPEGLSTAFCSFVHMFKNDFMFYLQDDFELIRKIDFDEVIDTIYSEYINQVRFNKRKTMPYKGDGEDRIIKTEMDVNGYPFVTSDAWYLNPSLWRMNFIRPYLEMDYGGKPRQRPFVWKLNDAIRKSIGVKNKKNIYKFSRHAGTYIWGRIGEPAYFRHLGSDRRMQFKSKVW